MPEQHASALPVAADASVSVASQVDVSEPMFALFCLYKPDGGIPRKQEV